MTNFERIKKMSVEQMADMLSTDDILIEPCNERYCEHYDADGICKGNKEVECRRSTIKWLNSEVANHD